MPRWFHCQHHMYIVHITLNLRHFVSQSMVFREEPKHDPFGGTIGGCTIGGFEISDVHKRSWTNWRPGFLRDVSAIPLCNHHFRMPVLLVDADSQFRQVEVQFNGASVRCFVVLSLFQSYSGTTDTSGESFASGFAGGLVQQHGFVVRVGMYPHNRNGRMNNENVPYSQENIKIFEIVWKPMWDPRVANASRSQ